MANEWSPEQKEFHATLAKLGVPPPPPKEALIKIQQFAKEMFEQYGLSREVLVEYLDPCGEPEAVGELPDPRPQRSSLKERVEALKEESSLYPPEMRRYRTVKLPDGREIKLDLTPQVQPLQGKTPPPSPEAASKLATAEAQKRGNPFISLVKLFESYLQNPNQKKE